MKTKRGQSLIDIVAAGTGSVADLIQTAILNDLSLSEDLSINEEIKISGVVNSEIVQLFSNNSPATGINKIISDSKKGIGIMKIGTTFKIG